MDVLALILACSLYPDDALVRALVDIQSHDNSYFVGDLSTLKTSDSLTSVAGALRVAQDIASHGGRPAVGLLGIPFGWAGRLGRSPRDLFDGCTNIAIGTAMLSEFEETCAPTRLDRASKVGRHHSRYPAHVAHPLASVRGCVLARFASELGVQGATGAVLQRAAAYSPAVTAETPARASAIFGEGVDDSRVLPADWSDTRLYLDVADEHRIDRASSEPRATKFDKPRGPP